MAVPKFYEFFPSFLSFLADDKEHNRKEIYEHCINSFQLSEEDKKETIPSGQNKLENRISWAGSYLKKAGLINSPKRSIFIITPIGKKVLQIQKSKDILTVNYVRGLAEKNSQQSPNNNSAISNTEENNTPQEAIDIAVEQLKSELINDLLLEIRSMDEYVFEQLVVDLLLKMGYGKPEENQNAVTKKSADGGIDGIVRADIFGFDAIYTQAKRWKEDSHVQAPDIQKFLGAMVNVGATKGVFITTGQFSKGAIDCAVKNPGHKIVLIDGERLAELMIKYGLGVTTVKTYEIKRIDSDYFNN